MRARELLLVLVAISAARAAIVNFESIGGFPSDDSNAVAWKNGALVNATLAKLQPNDVFLFPNKTFHMMGGIQGSGLRSVVFQFEGTIVFSNNIQEWPRDADGKVHECIFLNDIKNVTFTSSHRGLLDGNGGRWWGFPAIGYLIRQENRPRLLNVRDSTDLLVENLVFKDSPYWTFWVHNVDGLEVRYCEISARRTQWNKHDLLDMTAFNTDGFDVTGKNVWIHDCTVWNQDDTIAVKDGSENMLFERITASGVGLTIGSIGSSTVRNITFRDCHMPNTFKGIYLKFRAGDGGLIEDVTFENIVIDSPNQWPIWIGPAQQSDSVDLCAAHPCSICWPTVPFSKCEPPESLYRNIMLRNITINNPKMSPGVIMASSGTPMDTVVFENVRVNNPGKKPWGNDYYKCENVVKGVATGNTWPVPPCFQDLTDFV